MKIVLEKISRLWASIIAFTLSYALFVSTLWSFVSPITYFAQDYLKLKLSGITWFSIFYVLPLLPSAISTVILLANTRYNPYLNEFRKNTERNLRRVRRSITGSGTRFQKQEVFTCEDQLRLGNAVLLTGEGGTGKSGIGAALVEAAQLLKKPVLLADARQLEHIRSEIELSQYYLSIDDFVGEITELGRISGFRIVIDQLDNVAGKPTAGVIAEFAIACHDKVGVEVVVISRKRESFETQLLQPLIQSGFVEIECQELGEREVREELQNLGVINPTVDLLELCRNLLNLEIVSKLREENPEFRLEAIDGEVMLWDSYFDTLRDREAEQPDPRMGERVLYEAMNLAKEVLVSGNQEIVLANPLSEEHRRLVSGKVILKLEGVRYRFGHEKFQDYLYARYAVDRGYMPEKIVAEIGQMRSRNTTAWVEEIYRNRGSADHAKFLEEIFNG